MIEYYSPHKKIWLKLIAGTLIVTFVWYDIAWAGDLFYYPRPIPVATAAPAVTGGKMAPTSAVPDEKVASGKEKEREVTNYDLLYYDKRKSAAEKLLPTYQEKEQSQKFAPGYIQEQQQKHEDIIKQKQDGEDLLWQLRDDLKKKLQVEKEEDLELQKKQGGSGGRGGEGGEGDDADYSLTDPDVLDTPHNLNNYNYEGQRNLNSVDKYDVTRMDIEKWMNGAERRTDEMGVDYWIGWSDQGDAGDGRKIQEVIYFGEGEGRKIDHLLTGYVLNEATQEYEAKYRIDYIYSGDDVAEVRRYDISGDGDVLVEVATYEGSGEDNRISKIEYFGTDGDLAGTRLYEYGDGGELQKTEEHRMINGTDILTSETHFTGEAKKEVADHTTTYASDGTGLTTTVYYYADGDRAADAGYREAKTKSVTYWGNIDTNGDGSVSAEEEAAADKKSELFFCGSADRIAGEEVADYEVTYNKLGFTTATTVYLYLDGKRAKDANYRETLTSIVSYYGDAVNADGSIKDGAIKKSQTFFDHKYRLKGEEVQDYAVTFLTDGATVKDTTVYFYEGGKRAEDSSNTDRLERATTYWGPIDSNGDKTISAGEISAAHKKSETFYRFLPGSSRGEELADFTYSYYRDGSTVKETTVYYYGGNKRADTANPYEDGMQRSDTYWGDAIFAVDLIDAGGNYDIARVEELIKIKFGIDLASAGSGTEALEAFLDYISGGDAGIKEALRAILAMDPADIANKEKLVSALLTIAGGNVDLLQILMSIDMDSVTSKEDLVEKILVAAGLDQTSAAVISIILSVKITDGMTKEDYVRALLDKISPETMTSKVTSLLGKLSKKISDYASADELKAELLALAAGDEELLALINSVTVTAGMTAEEFISALFDKISPETLTSKVTSLLGKLSKK
ncbi:MAG: hypothetical protein WC515_04350, partial [Candidatus Omnitrophota bacterium]